MKLKNATPITLNEYYGTVVSAPPICKRPFRSGTDAIAKNRTPSIFQITLRGGKNVADFSLQPTSCRNNHSYRAGRAVTADCMPLKSPARAWACSLKCLAQARVHLFFSSSSALCFLRSQRLFSTQLEC